MTEEKTPRQQALTEALIQLDRDSREFHAQRFDQAEFHSYQLTVPAGTTFDADGAVDAIRKISVQLADGQQFESIGTSNPNLQGGQRHTAQVDFVAKGKGAQAVADAFRDKATVRGGERGMVKPSPLPPAERGPVIHLRSR